MEAIAAMTLLSDQDKLILALREEQRWKFKDLGRWLGGVTAARARQVYFRARDRREGYANEMPPWSGWVYRHAPEGTRHSSMLRLWGVLATNRVCTLADAAELAERRPCRVPSMGPASQELLSACLLNADGEEFFEPGQLEER